MIISIADCSPAASHVRERRLHVRPPLAVPIASLEEPYALAHRELARLDTVTLERERHRARHRPVLDDCPSPWLAERIMAIDAELRRRGRGRA